MSRKKKRARTEPAIDAEETRAEVKAADDPMKRSPRVTLANLDRAIQSLTETLEGLTKEFIRLRRRQEDEGR